MVNENTYNPMLKRLFLERKRQHNFFFLANNLNKGKKENVSLL